MHNDTWLKGGKEYLYAIKDFIEKSLEHRMNKDTSNRNYIGGGGAGANTGSQLNNQGGATPSNLTRRQGGH